MLDYLHYIVVVPIILIILILQVRVFRSALARIKRYRLLFPDNKESYGINKALVELEDKTSLRDPVYSDGDSDIWEEDDDETKSGSINSVLVSQITTYSDNPLFLRIVDALNMYLLKNKGAVSDFLLIKDVVERHSEMEEEEIDVVQPIPLYLGLMGTMIGIIVGVGLIALHGNIQSLANISPLLGCVAVAMLASFMGILFTTVISWKSKGAKSEVEENKNLFYSWLQTELLPVLSGNAVSALTLLQSNLTEFNRTFTDNIKTFDTVLSDIRKVSNEQASTIDAISRIDIKRVAQANITVLQELQRSTGNIDRFNSYIGKVNDYVASIEVLNNKLSVEMAQMEGRSDYIKGIVGSIDSALKDSMEQFNAGMNAFVSSAKEENEKNISSVKESYNKQYQSYLDDISKLQDELLARTKDFQKIVDGIAALSLTQKSISQLLSSTERNGERLDHLSHSLSRTNGTGNHYSSKGNTVHTVLLAIITAVALASGVTYMVKTIGPSIRDYSIEEEYQVPQPVETAEVQIEDAVAEEKVQ